MSRSDEMRRPQAARVERRERPARPTPRGTRRPMSRPTKRPSRVRRAWRALSAFVRGFVRGVQYVLSIAARWFRRTVPVVLAAALIVALPVGAYLGVHGWLNSMRFAVQSVEITGLERVDSEEVRRVAGLDAPRNVLTVDVAEVAAHVRQIPWVKDVDVRVAPGGVVHIDVQEAHLAGVAVLVRPYLVDTDGVPIRPWVATDGPPSPLLVGLGSDVDGAAPPQDLFFEALHVAERYATSVTGSQIKLSELHYNAAHGFRLVLADRTEVRIGHDRLDERLSRLDDVMRAATRAGLGQVSPYDVVHLDAPRLDRVTVRPRREQQHAPRVGPPETQVEEG